MEDSQDCRPFKKFFTVIIRKFCWQVIFSALKEQVLQKIRKPASEQGWIWKKANYANGYIQGTQTKEREVMEEVERM